MTSPTSRRPRLLVAGSGVLVALLAAAPVQAAGAGPDIFAGSAEALALDLRITAPTDVLAALTDVVGGATGIDLTDLRQKVSLTRVDLNSDGVVNAAGALLTDGLFDTGLLSSTADQPNGSQSIVARDDGVIALGVGTVEYVADAAGNLVSSRSELASLDVTLAPLFAADSPLPPEVTAPLQDAVGQATEAVDGLVGELNGVLDQVETAVEDTVGTVIEIPEVLPDALPRVPDVTQVDLASVRMIWSESSVTTDGDLVRSVAESGIVGASLLGGVVEVPALTYRSFAETAGTPGTAKSGTEITEIALNVGETTVRVDETTLTVGDFTLDLTSPEFEGLPLDQVLDPVTALLGEILDAAGLSVTPGLGTSDAAPDGSRAAAQTSAFALRLTPLNAAGQADVLDIQLSLAPTTVAVAAAPAPVAAPQAVPQLPRTGGGAAALGLAALGSATLLRRRRDA